MSRKGSPTDFRAMLPLRSNCLCLRLRHGFEVKPLEKLNAQSPIRNLDHRCRNCVRLAGCRQREGLFKGRCGWRRRWPSSGASWAHRRSGRVRHRTSPRKVERPEGIAIGGPEAAKQAVCLGNEGCDTFQVICARPSISTAAVCRIRNRLRLNATAVKHPPAAGPDTAQTITVAKAAHKTIGVPSAGGRLVDCND